jgi:GntR family transcriptional regulator
VRGRPGRLIRVSLAVIAASFALVPCRQVTGRLPIDPRHRPATTPGEMWVVCLNHVVVSYLTLSDELEAELASATPGDLVSSEMELARRYRVSRLTARAALKELERRHVVRRMQGRGTFVLRRLDYRITSAGPLSFTEIVTQAGGKPSTTVEHVEERVATAPERRTLGLPARAKVVELFRRRWLEGEPVSVDTSVMPLELVPGIRDRLADDTSLYRLLVDVYDLRPRRAWYRGAVVSASAEVARLLDLRSRTDLHYSESRLESDRLERPIEMNKAWLRTDLFNVVVEVGAFR